MQRLTRKREEREKKKCEESCTLAPHQLTDPDQLAQDELEQMQEFHPCHDRMLVALCRRNYLWIIITMGWSGKSARVEGDIQLRPPPTPWIIIIVSIFLCNNSSTSGLTFSHISLNPPQYFLTTYQHHTVCSRQILAQVIKCTCF